MKKHFVNLVSLVAFTMVLNSCKKKEDAVTPTDPCKAYYVTYTVDNVTRTLYYDYYFDGNNNSSCDNINTDPNDFGVEVINPIDSSKMTLNLNKKQNTFNSLQVWNGSYGSSRSTPLYGASGSMVLNNKNYTSANTTDTTQFYNKVTSVRGGSVESTSKSWDVTGEFKMQMINNSNSTDIKVVTGTYKYTFDTNRK